MSKRASKEDINEKIKQLKADAELKKASFQQQIKNIDNELEDQLHELTRDLTYVGLIDANLACWQNKLRESFSAEPFDPADKWKLVFFSRKPLDRKCTWSWNNFKFSPGSKSIVVACSHDPEQLLPSVATHTQRCAIVGITFMILPPNMHPPETNTELEDYGVYDGFTFGKKVKIPATDTMEMIRSRNYLSDKRGNKELKISNLNLFDVTHVAAIYRSDGFPFILDTGNIQRETMTRTLIDEQTVLEEKIAVSDKIDRIAAIIKGK